MAIDLKSILDVVNKIIDLEKQVEKAVESETNKKRKKKIQEAVKARDRDALRKLMFDK